MRDSLYFDVLKEPRGFIKCIEIFLAIFAFSCATGYRGSFKILQTKETEPKISHAFEGHFKYPFDVPVRVPMITNASQGTEEMINISVSERSSAEFFVVIGVFCFLYCVGVLVYYIVFQKDDQIQATPTSGYLNPPVIDFVVGGFWTFFWFVSSCAQAAAVSGVKDATSAEDLVKSLTYCQGDFSCSVVRKAKYATLTVSILLGFLNAFVWGGNMWFLWKETPWHQRRNNPTPTTVTQQQNQPPQQVPSAI